MTLARASRFPSALWLGILLTGATRFGLGTEASCL